MRIVPFDNQHEKKKKKQSNINENKHKNKANWRIELPLCHWLPNISASLNLVKTSTLEHDIFYLILIEQPNNVIELSHERSSALTLMVQNAHNATALHSD